MDFATTVVGIITAVATVITALSLLIASVNGFRKINRVETKIDDVHILVNQKQTDLRNYIAALVAELNEHDMKVPRDQSNPPPV